MPRPRDAKCALGGLGACPIRLKAAPRRRRSTPYRQGDLDGLCGVYAIVNAVRCLRPSLTQPQAEALFAQLMRVARGLDKGRVAIARKGLTHTQMHRLIEAARTHMLKSHRVHLVAQKVPFDLRRQWSIGVLWRLIARQVKRKKVVLLGLFGRHDHWTLAVGITRGQITLYDSDDLRVLRRSLCTVAPHDGRPSLNVIKARDVVALGLRRRRPLGL